MDCDSIWDLLSVYADGEASADEAADVEAHIAVCATCARDLEFMHGTAVALQEVPEVAPPASLRSAIVAATVGRQTVPQRVAAAVRRTLTPTPVRYGSLATVGAAAAVTLIALRSGHDGPASPVAYHPESGTQTMAAVPPVDLLTGGASLLPPDLPVLQPAKPARLRPTGHRAVRTMLASAPDGGTHALRPRATAPRVATATQLAGPVTAYRAKVTPADGSGAGTGTEDASPVVPDEPTAPPVAPEPDRRTIEAPPAHVASADTPRVQLVASSSSVGAGQASTLADLKRALRQQAPGLTGADMRRSARDSEIRVDVLRGTF